MNINYILRLKIGILLVSVFLNVQLRHAVLCMNVSPCVLFSVAVEILFLCEIALQDLEKSNKVNVQETVQEHEMI